MISKCKNRKLYLVKVYAFAEVLASSILVQPEEIIALLRCIASVEELAPLVAPVKVVDVLPVYVIISDPAYNVPEEANPPVLLTVNVVTASV